MTTAWIPVSERLPEHETEVLVYMVESDCSLRIGLLVEVDFGVWDWRVVGAYRSECPVTHWMPLPAPPGADLPPPTRAQRPRLSEIEANLLDWIKDSLESDRQLSTRELARRIGRAHTTLREHLTELERKGYVRLERGRVAEVVG